MPPEQLIKDSELRYRRLFEAAQDGILILDAETGMIEDVNPYLMKMLGYSHDEFVKRKLWEVGAFKDMEASKDAFEALQDNEYIRYEDLPLKTKDGKLIQVEFVSNVYQAGGEKVIQCNIRDNTEHKRIVTALQDNEKKYFNLLDQSSDGIFIIDLSGNILTVNKAMRRELEYSEEEFLSMKVWDIIPPQYLDQYRARLTKILTGESFEEVGKYEVRGKGGRNHYVEVLSTPHYNGSDIIGFQGIARDVTERKRAEEALQESEARNRRLVEYLPTVVYTNAVGDASSTIYVSPQIEALLGYTPQEWLADPKLWSKTVHPEDRQRVLAQTAHTDQSKEPYEMEYRMIARDGRLVWVHDQIVLMKHLDQEGQLWQGIMLDITERKLAEQKLQKEKDRAQQYLDIAGVIFLVLGADQKVILINRKGCEILGYLEEEIVGQNWIDHFLPQAEKDRSAPAFVQIMAGEMELVEYFESRILTKSGQQRLVAWHNSALNDEAGRIIGIVSSGEDITERKQAEDALYESEERFKNAFQYSAIGMALVSLDGHWLKVNSTLCSILGYSEDELLTKTFQDITHPDDLGTDLIYLSQLLAGEIFSYTMEKRYFHKEGNTVSVLLAVALARDNAGAPLYLISQIEDITERKQAEKRIHRQINYLTALQDSDRTIASAADMRLSLKALTSKAVSLLAVDAAAVLLIDFSMNTLEFAAADGFRTDAIKTAHLKLDGSHAGRVVQEGHIVKIPDLQNEPDALFLRGFFDGEDFIGYYGVPLVVNGKVIAVFEVFQRSMIKRDQEWLDFLNALAGQAAIAIHTSQLFANLQRSNVELSRAYDATIEGWSRALDLRDKETEGHSQRVTEMTVDLARSFGLRGADLMQVRWGSLLHDIGKMGVPDGILLKAGPLTEDEWVAMKKHPIFAYEMLSPVDHLRLALDIPYCHHEKWDGSGYPRGLKGEQIPLTARIFAVVDVWDALRSDRPYRAAWPVEKVREHIRALSGTHFDPQVVDRFLEVLE